MKRLVLMLPPLFLLLSVDSILPEVASAPLARPTQSLAHALAGLPGRNEGRFGRAGDALNLVFIGDRGSVEVALREAGWTEVPLSVRACVAAGAGELLAGRALAAFPPMNDYALAGRRQDMNWAIPIRGVAERHHFRLWNTGRRDAAGRTVWWGSGNYDLRMRWHDLSHVPEPDTDRERDFIAGTLRGGTRVALAALVPLPQIPRSGANDKGYAFYNDGRAAVVVLKPL